jgi:hypothetical protein
MDGSPDVHGIVGDEKSLRMIGLGKCLPELFSTIVLSHCPCMENESVFNRQIVLGHGFQVSVQPFAGSMDIRVPSDETNA